MREPLAAHVYALQQVVSPGGGGGADDPLGPHAAGFKETPSPQTRLLAGLARAPLPNHRGCKQKQRLHVSLAEQHAQRI